MGSHLTLTSESSWSRLKRHFSESFSGELVYRRRAHDMERVDEQRVKRQRNAYRYILLLLAVILVPIDAHNLYLGELVPAVGGLLLLGILMINILLLSMNREAFLTPPLVLLLSISLVMLSVYYGQNYNLYLLYPLLVALPILLKTRWAVLLGVLSGLVAAPLVFTQYDHTTAMVIGASMGLTWLVSAWLVYAVTEQSRRLKDMAITDPLTGAYNRRYLELQLEQVLETWTRYQRPASVLLIDIDHFKRINDKFGHGVGDSAIKNLVEVISRNIRNVDTLCRYGGEEFVVLLAETPLSKARPVAEKLRAAVENTRVVPEVGMTISVGVCDVSVADGVDHWLNLADAALYLAKRNGRNRVELAESAIELTVPLDKTIPDWR
ncbi:MAG: GGDEF domain-containing protein [Gammaproteobacteria bacterium]|nr:GGDEF domain-containing protein [Gammaproteobacteria bacterium]